MKGKRQSPGAATVGGAGACDERARLRELYSLRVLDKGPEKRFDRITRLVADVFDVPVCLITLVAEDLQWIKAEKGLPLRQMDRRDSFCTHALGQDLLVVEDAREDPTFAGKPLVVQAPCLRFYAGAVLHGPTGQPLGTLCILDREPRGLGSAEKRRLREFAAIVEEELAFDQHLQQAREQLLASVLHDPVTGLPGELLVEERLNTLVENAREDGESIALAVVRFLEYDQVLGTYGQEALDRAARMFAGRLRTLTGTHGLVGRLSVDRMLVARSGVDGEAALEAWAGNVYDTLTEPYSVADGQRRAPAAVGVAGFPAHARNATELLTRAVVAKDNRPNAGPRIYDPEHDQRIQYRDRLHRRLTEALERDQLTLAFQPIFDATGCRPLGCEALARWQDAELGQISPGEFIPLAESDPRLRRALTRWVLRTACTAAAAWNVGRQTAVPVSVNVAGPELHDPGLVDEVDEALGASGLAPERLVLELTERTLIGDLDAASRSVRRLAERGVHCALDDFGTGYSSLSYLRSIPLHGLKMDRSFVAEVACDGTAREVARGIVNIGRALGLSVIAEGVETEAQRAHLQAIGCDGLQGFLLARPQPLNAWLRLLDA